MNLGKAISMTGQPRELQPSTLDEALQACVVALDHDELTLLRRIHARRTASADPTSPRYAALVW